MIETRAAIGPVTLALALAACHADAPPPAVSTVRDSAGVPIVENVAPDAPGVAVWSFSTALELGDADGDGPTAFFQVMGALRLPDGGLVVADRGSGEIRFFDADGRFLRATGGKGEGPGEFRGIQQLIRGPADSLYVHDGDAQRISVLSPGGAFVREFPLVTGAVPGELLGRLPDGAWLAHTSELSGKLDFQPGFNRGAVHVIRVPGEGGVTDTIGAFPGRMLFFRVTERGASASPPPFAHVSLFATARSAFFVSTGDDDAVREYDAQGTLMRVIRTGYAPVPVTADLVDGWVRQRVSALPAAKTPTDVSPEQAIRRSIEDVPLPASVPPFGLLLADPAGELWVVGFAFPGDDTSDWAVYDAEGRIRARMRFPSRFRPFDVSPDWVLGTIRDELDVEHIRLYRRR